MNAVEFCFALGAVTMMTTVIYIWTSFVYKIEEQRDEEPPRRKMAGASRHVARENDSRSELLMRKTEDLSAHNAAQQ